MALSSNRVSNLLAESQVQILADWVKQLRGVMRAHSNAVTEAEVQAECQALLAALAQAFASGSEDLDAEAWSDVREQLGDMSRLRTRQGFSPSETATLVMSLKQPLLEHMRRAFAGKDEVQMFTDIVEAWKFIDELALFTTEVHQKAREELITRQSEDMLELSTPVIQLWQGVLALPIIGMLDSARTNVVMETLLERIVTTGSPIAILDITGVPTVDTLTAQYLLKTVAAVRLMGAECIISGIRPQIAQTIVHLGLELGGVTTKATLVAAFQLALKRLGHRIETNPVTA